MMVSRDKGSKTGHDETRDELVKELKYLRSVIRDVGEGYIIRKEGEIEALLGYLDALPTRAVRQMSRGWLKEMRNLPVKPSRGRLKDLKRIDMLLEDLLDAVIELQDSTRPKRAKTRIGPGVEIDGGSGQGKTA